MCLQNHPSLLLPAPPGVSSLPAPVSLSAPRLLPSQRLMLRCSRRWTNAANKLFKLLQPYKNKRILKAKHFNFSQMLGGKPLSRESGGTRWPVQVILCLSNGRCCYFDYDFNGEEESSKLLQSSYSLGGGTHYHITSTSYRCHHAGQTLIFASNDIYGI